MWGVQLVMFVTVSLLDVVTWLCCMRNGIDIGDRWRFHG